MYKFTDDCLIGIHHIDEEHRYLFQLVEETQSLLENQFINDKYDRICHMIERLEGYVDQHFRHEEEYMDRIHHPELELQKKQHLEFSVKVTHTGLVAGGKDQQEILGELLTYLITWLYRHVIGYDLMIGKMKPLEIWRKTPLEFTDKYKTGIILIDEEHKHLFDVMSKIHDVVVDENYPNRHDTIVALLKQIRESSEEHFQDEEEYMERIHYEGLNAQKMAHESFLERMDSIDMSLLESDEDDHLSEILAFLVEWVVNHILFMDRKLSQTIQH